MFASSPQCLSGDEDHKETDDGEEDDEDEKEHEMGVNQEENDNQAGEHLSLTPSSELQRQHNLEEPGQHSVLDPKGGHLIFMGRVRRLPPKPTFFPRHSGEANFFFKNNHFSV